MTTAQKKEYGRWYYAPDKFPRPGFVKPHGEVSYKDFLRIGKAEAKLIGFVRTEAEVYDLMPGEFRNARAVQSISFIALGKLIFGLRKAMDEG